MRINKILKELIIIFLSSQSNKSIRITEQGITIINNLVNGSTQLSYS